MVSVESSVAHISGFCRCLLPVIGFSMISLSCTRVELDVTRYDSACEVDDDCVVINRNVCSACLGSDAVNASDHEAATDDAEALRVWCLPQDAFCDGSAEAFCDNGTCDVRAIPVGENG